MAAFFYIYTLDKNLTYLKIITYIIIFFICNGLSAQEHIGLDILNGKKSITIPFKNKNGFIVIQAKFNKYFDLNFIFDTGATNNILFDKIYVDAIGKSYSDTISVWGADLSRQVDALICKENTLKFNSHSEVLRNFLVINEFSEKLEKSLGMHIHGILGGEFIKGLTVKIDYKNNRLTLYDPIKYKPKGKAIDIRVINKKPYIQCESWYKSKKYDILLLIDTGSSIPLILRSEEIKSIQDNDTTTISSFLGVGLNGEIIGNVDVLEQFTIGQDTLRNIRFSNQLIPEDINLNVISKSGIIGEQILSRYTMTIDYLRMKIYLNKRTDYKKTIDKSGIILHSIGRRFNRYKVVYVIPDSPAYLSGIKKGDEIIKYGILPKQLFSIQYLRKKLRSKEGKRIKLKLRRLLDEYNVTFHLQDYRN